MQEIYRPFRTPVKAKSAKGKFSESGPFESSVVVSLVSLGSLKRFHRLDLKRDRRMRQPGAAKSTRTYMIGPDSGTCRSCDSPGTALVPSPDARAERRPNFADRLFRFN